MLVVRSRALTATDNKPRIDLQRRLQSFLPPANQLAAVIGQPFATARAPKGRRRDSIDSSHDEFACLEYTTGGTLKGEADFVTAKVEPTGRRYDLQCCFVFHFNANGLIDKVHEYFDMATVQRFAPVSANQREVVGAN